MKNTLVAVGVVIILILIGAAAYFWMHSGAKTDTMMEGSQDTSSVTGAENGSTSDASDQSTAAMAPGNASVIGKSVEGRDILAYHYGTGSDEVLFIGGIHGGYEWNTALVAYNLMDYLTANPQAVPANEAVTVIPVLNPDGLTKVVGTADGNFSAADVPALAQTIPGRYNANKVDLNRNFDCDWNATGVWQNTKVNGGDSAFSEPESKALQGYIAEHKPTAVVVWFSSAGGVYASNCHNGVSAETKAITKVYADASGYPAHQSFDFYATTGDVTNWLAKLNIPAISVLLTNHTDTEWSKNQAGVTALLNHYAK